MGTRVHPKLLPVDLAPSLDFPSVRDPAPWPSGGAALHLREQIRAQLARHQPFWLFAYGSLLWKPDFEPQSCLDARVWGHHRALRMYSRVNRGSPERPGLVFALLSGGSCHGQVLQVAVREHDEVLDRLWAREMVTGVYTPRWLVCRTPQGPVRALAFTLPRSSPSHTGCLSDAQLLDIFRHAHGRCGRALDYLLETARRLKELRIRDAEVERLVRLAHRHRLADHAA